MAVSNPSPKKRKTRALYDNSTLASAALIFFVGGFALAWIIATRGIASSGGGLVRVITATPVPTSAVNYSGNANSNSQTPIPTDKIDVSDAPSWGPADAKVTIVEFGDFECPYCEQFFQNTYPLIHDNYNHLIRYVWRNLPLPSHPDAYQAAIAAECANEQGKFWQYHDMLYTNQQDLSVTALSQYASQIKLAMPQFTSCFQSEKYKDKIQRDEQLATQYGVAGTPTFFVNGYSAQGAESYSNFNTALSALLVQTGEVQVF